MVRVIAFLALFLAGVANAAITVTATIINDDPSGSTIVNWIDTASYAKPPAITINKPNEATVTNKYWVDLGSGSGTTCSQASPCSMDGVLGKAGLAGGPAIIYIKGTGQYSWFNDTVRGSGDADCRTQGCANWILVRTWPAGSTGCAVECTATITGNSNMNSSNVNHVIFDGGPDLKIRINSNGGSGTYGHNINSNYFVIYRTQAFCATAAGVWQVGATTVASNIYFINNEFYGCLATGEQASSVYVGPGASGGYSNFVFQNNIVRDMAGEGIEINPRVTSNNATITGNVFYNNGFVTCGAGFQCRPAIVMSIQSGGGNNGTVITNNVMWNLASGCIWDRGGGSPAPIIANNTCYDYGNGSGGGGPNPQGISGFGGAGSATLRNNIIFDPGGVDPHNGTYSNSQGNACGSGKSCGTSSQVWSAAQWLSTSTASSDYLRVGPSSIAVDHGITTTATTIDFLGVPRPQGSAYDIGAYER